MSTRRQEPGPRAIHWFRLVMTRVLAFLTRKQARLMGGTPRIGFVKIFGTGSRSLPVEQQQILRDLGSKGVVVDTVASAIEDYLHFREVLMGPAASSDAVDDVSLLAEAESALSAIILSAPRIKVLTEVATQRGADRAGREAAGYAILRFRDQGRALHELASASLRWASSHSEEDERRMHALACDLIH